MKKYIITGIMAAIAATSVMAGTPVASKEVVEVAPPCLFRDNELQFDIYGLGHFYQGTSGEIFGPGSNVASFSGRPAWGGGLGVSYFLTRYIGLGLEQSVFGRRSGNSGYSGPAAAGVGFTGDYGYTRWATIGNLILRYPICQWNLAPYMLVGGGAMYGNHASGPLTVPGAAKYRMAGAGLFNVGGGLEYRLTENIGLFTDARYMASDVRNLPHNSLYWRYGVRFAF